MIAHVTDEKKSKILCAFISLYLSLSVINWLDILPRHWFRIPMYHFSTDLSGTYFPLFVRGERPFLSLLSGFEGHVILFVLEIALAILFAKGAFYRVTAWLLFANTWLIGNLIPGRHFVFEAISLILLSQAIGRHLGGEGKPYRLLNRLVFASLCAVYFSAFIAKIFASGLGWYNPYTFPLMVKLHTYLIETETMLFPNLSIMLWAAALPPVITGILSVAPFIVEGVSPLFLLNRRILLLLAPILWIPMHVVFGLTVGVFSVSLVITILIVSWPESSTADDSRRTRWICISFMAAVLVLTWTLPRDKYQQSTIFFPLGHYGMFSQIARVHPDKQAGLALLYLRPKPTESDDHFSTRVVFEPLGHGPYYIMPKLRVDHNRPSLPDMGRILCDKIVTVWLTKKGTAAPQFEVWVRYLRPKGANSISQEDRFITSCPRDRHGSPRNPVQGLPPPTLGGDIVVSFASSEYYKLGP